MGQLVDRCKGGADREEPQPRTPSTPPASTLQPVNPPRNNTSAAAPPPSSAPQVPQGWETRTDPSGRVYYLNHNTKVLSSPLSLPIAQSVQLMAVVQTTHWELPANVSASSTGGLPAGWEQRSDPKNGRTYYVNHTDQSTHWELPGSHAPPPPPPGRGQVGSRTECCC